jgi:hypothetical protein
MLWAHCWCLLGHGTSIEVTGKHIHMIAVRTLQQHYACKMIMSLIINIGESLRKSQTITFIMSRDELP